MTLTEEQVAIIDELIRDRIAANRFVLTDETADLEMLEMMELEDENKLLASIVLQAY